MQTTGAVTDSGTIDVSILGGRKFTGRWRPPKTMTMLSVLGGREIDLREAEIPADGITINVVGLIGERRSLFPTASMSRSAALVALAVAALTPTPSRAPQESASFD